METKQDNVVYIGGKMFRNYVDAVVMKFRNTNDKTVIIKARGKFTSRAIDVSEVAIRNSINKKIKVTNVLTGSEEYTTKEGKKANVSIIEITLGGK